MAEIPNDIWATATRWAGMNVAGRHENLTDTIAQALMAERERTAGLATQRRERFSTIQGVEMSCREVAPGKTMQELVVLFEAASKEGSPFAGNPSKWPVTRGVKAVVEAVLDGYASAIRSIPENKNG